MAAVATPRRSLPRPKLSLTERFEHLPSWGIAGGLLVVLLTVSAFIRTRYIGGQFWMDEAITTGIASHSLSAIPGILRHDGSPPLFYLLLHLWMSVFGSSEAATHALPLLLGLATIPVGMWAGWSLFGRRAGLIAAVLFAFSTFLTQYAQETRMYELMGLLGLLAATAFIHAFVYRRRKYLILFAVCEALMLYTHAWGMFFGAGSVLALIPVYLASADRRGLIRDAAMAYAGAAALFAPWLPNFVYQATHTGAPWAPPPRFGAPVLISRDLMGGDRITIGLLLATVVGLGTLFTKRYRRTREATVMWTLIALPVATLLTAWLASQITPAFVSRYFAPVLGPILLLAAWGLSRARAVGIVALVLSVVFVVHISSYTPQYKSDMRDVGGEMTPLLHSGDLVISAQPEQVPLAWYYLPAGVQYASTLGRVSDPTYMNWVFALKRLRASQPAATLAPLLASLKPGQQLLFIRP
ncbi:MAG: glycosyltransferase family 39 protein, partial [Actinomycetota bacterium]|nr:glycosyltransferase family 39 protein [Actinomycetota bacterium]